MSKLDVIKIGNEHLRRNAEPVAPEQISTPEMQKLIKDMIETMHAENGVGIAAPQVDSNLRVIITMAEEGKPRVWINPELSNLSFAKVKSDEGCLSVPGQWGTVMRHRSCTLTALNEKGEKIEEKATGFFAIVLQHEVDHLNGVLFVDRATDISKTE